jgi:hypothetical protein
MRVIVAVILGLISGLIGALAGWFGLALLVVTIAGPGNDGGVAMGAFFQIGPFGGLVGFALGVAAFWRFGFSRRPAAPPGEEAAGAAPRRISRPFAALVAAIALGLAWAGWWEFIRSPYLSHGFMTLALQFRLPEGMAAPAEAKDVQIEVMEGGRPAMVAISDKSWRGHDGSRAVILASASFAYKTGRRTVTLTLPGQSPQTWVLDLPSDPEPMPDYSPWRLSGSATATKIEMNYWLGAD